MILQPEVLMSLQSWNQCWSDYFLNLYLIAEVVDVV